MYFVLLLFITSPFLTAVSLICVITSSVTLTYCPTINTTSTYAIYCLVLLKIVPFTWVSIFLITFSSTVLNSVVQSASLVSSHFLCQMLRSFDLGFSLFCSNPAVSFLSSSLISLESQTSLKFCINMFYLLSHRPT